MAFDHPSIREAPNASTSRPDDARLGWIVMTADPMPEAGQSTAAPAARGRLVGGVCAGLATRTGVPITVVRAAWVAAVLLLAAAQQPIIAWIVILAYGVAWWSASRARGGEPTAAHVTGRAPEAAPHAVQDVHAGSERLRQPPPPAPAAQLPASAQGQPAAGPAGQGERPYLSEFVNYLWSAETSPQPVYKFSAHGFVLSDMPLPKEKMTVQLRLVRTPYGRIVVWPGWLVFMTESHNRPGELPPASRLWSVVLDFVREYRRYTTLFSLAQTSYQLLTKEERDRFRGMLANPNSIVVPLHTVRDCQQERSLGNPRILIRTDDREIMFGPNGALEMFLSFWRMAAGMVGAWHPRFQKLMADAIAASQRRPQQP